MDDKTENNCSIELDVEGMDCPSCALRIEKNLSKIEGIDLVKVNLGTETAEISYKDSKVDLPAIKKAIEKIGYKAIEQGRDDEEDTAAEQRKRSLRSFKIKIFTSIILSVIVVSLGMKEHIPFLEPVPFDISNWISFVLSTIIIFWCGQKFIKGFIASIKVMTADMDTLIVMGTFSAYFYSIVIMLFPSLSGEHHPIVRIIRTVIISTLS